MEGPKLMEESGTCKTFEFTQPCNFFMFKPPNRNQGEDKVHSRITSK